MSQAATPRDAGYSPRPDPNRPLTEQGLYNLLVYHYWDEYLPHTRKVVRTRTLTPTPTLTLSLTRTQTLTLTLSRHVGHLFVRDPLVIHQVRYLVSGPNYLVITH